jgi:hypothetical protein
MFRIIRIAGNSLYPKIKPGDYVIIYKPPWLFNSITSGDLIVFNQNILGRMIKIVDSKNMEKGELTVSGLHSDSISSNSMGAIKKEDILGKVIWHIPGNK